MALDAFPAIVEEHDNTFGVKKVSIFADNGNGGLSRISFNGLGIGKYDYVSLSSYSGSNPQTIVFKTGGASGITIATLTLTYDGSGNLLTVTKT